MTSRHTARSRWKSEVCLTTAKLLIVVGFFMHLRHDSGGPRLVFFAPLVIALLMVLVLMLLYGNLI